MAEKNEIGKAYLKNVRLSFPHLDKPHASVRNGPEKFRAAFLADRGTPDGKKAIAELQRAAKEVIDATWPKAGGKFPGKADRKCLRKGEGCTNQSGEVYKGYEGMIAVNCANDTRPLLLHRNKKPIDESEINRTLYAGCRVEAIVRFYAITDPDKGGAGLFATVEGIRFWGDDEAFGGAGIDADAFDDDDEDENDDFGSNDGDDEDDVI